MSRPWRIALISTVTVVGAGAADSLDLADLSLEQLMDLRVASVEGASKYEQKVTQAPASVTVLDEEWLDVFGHRNLADVLRSVRGIFVSYDRSYSYLGMRGFNRPGDYNTRTLMLVDGHRLNEAIFDSFVVDNHGTPDLGVIKKVEVIRGPSSSVYGSNAFFGVINVVPRTGADVNGTEVALEAGNLGWRKARVTYGSKLGEKGDLIISTSLSDWRGNRSLYYPEFDPAISDDPRARDGGLVENSDGEEGGEVFAAAHFGDFHVTIFASSRRRDTPTASFETAFNAQMDSILDERAFVDLRFDREIRPELEWRMRAYTDGYRYEGTYSYETDEPDVYLVNRDKSYGVWAGLETHLRRRFGADNSFLLGGEYRNNLRQDMFNFDEYEEREYYVNWRGSGSTYAAFAEADIQLRPAVRLMSGVRLDGGDNLDGGKLFPRVGAIFDVWRGGTAKLLYGSAFRAPNAYETSYLTNEEPLRSERIHTYEAVLEQYWRDNFRGALNAYTYEVKDLITIGGDAQFQSARNIGRTSANGVEAEMEYTSPHMRLLTSVALQRSKDKETDDELSNSPRRLFKTQLVLPWTAELSSAAEVHYQSSARTITGDRVPAFWLTNLTVLQAMPRPELTVSLHIYNVFDEEYGYPGSTDHLQSMLLQDGRTYRLKIEYRF